MSKHDFKGSEQLRRKERDRCVQMSNSRQIQPRRIKGLYCTDLGDGKREEERGKERGGERGRYAVTIRAWAPSRTRSGRVKGELYSRRAICGAARRQ